MLSKAIFVHITFSNGDYLLSEEEKDLQKALAVRALMSFIQVSYMSTNHFYDLFTYKHQDWSMRTLFKIISCECNLSETNPRIVYFHIDEFNALYEKDINLFIDMVKILSAPLCKPPPGMFYFVLFTGTSYTAIKESFPVTFSHPNIELQMKILDKNGNCFFLLFFSSCFYFHY
jgi:hypothetical protein